MSSFGQCENLLKLKSKNDELPVGEVLLEFSGFSASSVLTVSLNIWTKTLEILAKNINKVDLSIILIFLVDQILQKYFNLFF